MIMLITQHWTTFLSLSTSNTVLILLNAILLTTCDYVSNGKETPRVAQGAMALPLWQCGTSNDSGDYCRGL